MRRVLFPNERQEIDSDVEEDAASELLFDDARGKKRRRSAITYDPALGNMSEPERSEGLTQNFPDLKSQISKALSPNLKSQIIFQSLHPCLFGDRRRVLPSSRSMAASQPNTRIEKSVTYITKH